MNKLVFGKVYSTSKVEKGLSGGQEWKQEDQLGCYCIAEPRDNGEQDLRSGSRDGQTDKHNLHSISKIASAYC